MATDLHGRWDRIRRWRDDSVDRLAGSDPGLNRLRTAVMAVVAIGAALLGEWGFVKGTGALQARAASPSQAAAVAAGNHALTVIAMLLGAMICLVGAIAVSDATAEGQLVSTLLLPVPLVAALALGLVIGGHRAVALASFPVLLALGGLAKRWGPRGAIFGMPLFIGDFIGFLLHGTVRTGDVGWLAAEVGVGALASLVVRFVLFFPDVGAALRRSQRSWSARARQVVALAVEDFTEPDGPDDADRRARRRRRQLNRLGEASLIIDAQLVDAGALPAGSSARRLHERLFEAELGLVNTARFAAALGRLDLPAPLHGRVAGILVALRDGERRSAVDGAHGLLDELGARAAEELTGPGSGIGGDLRQRRVLLHRFATSVVLLGESLDEWQVLGSGTGRDDRGVYVPPVTLVGGWLPGSAGVSASASKVAGERWYERAALPPYVRTAVQLAVAVGLATAIGDVVSPRRFYWAVIAAFVSFNGANNTIEAVRKAVARVGGTVVGLVIGSLVAQAVGTDVAGGLVAILVSLFFGLYLFRINYAFLVLGITVMVSQLYEQLDEFSNSLLLLRLAETAIGAGVAVVVVLVVLPLRTSRVVDVALGELLDAVRRLLVEVVDGRAPHAVVDLAPRAREVDAAYQTLVATTRPLGRVGDAARRARRLTIAAGALRHYTRNLVGDVPATGPSDGWRPAAGPEAAGRLLGSLDALRAAVTGVPGGRYVRAASRWNVVEQQALDELRRAVTSGDGLAGDVVAAMLVARDLQLLDGALADLAGLEGLGVDDLDTDPPPVGDLRSGDRLLGSSAAADVAQW